MRLVGLVCLATLITACGGTDMQEGGEPQETSSAALTGSPQGASFKVANFGVKPGAQPSKVLAPVPDGSGEPARSGQLLVKFKTPLAPTPTMQAFRGISERTLTDEATRRLPGLGREGLRVSRARALHAPHRLHPNARGTNAPTTAVGAYVVDVTGADDANIAELAKKVSSLPEVEWAEPNYVRQTSAVPNDTLYGYQWHLPAISAPSAWDTTKGAKHIVIAVVDSGVDYTHPDLAPNIWTNVDEVPGDGVDNDNNGFVDDVRGWDFEAGDADPQDELGHGTHVSGIAAARGNDGVGVAGVAWNATIMPVRAGNQGLADSNIVAAIHYAVDNGADVINMSFGGFGVSSAIQEAVRYAADRDVVLVAAAGNESGSHIPYPAGYPEVISVAALDENGAMASYSNSGSFVDVAAPGSNVVSTLPGGWGPASGTSMATPVVSGLAALAKSAHPDFTANAIRYQILSTATDLSVPNPTRVKDLGSGKVNAQRAVATRSTAPWVSLIEHSFTEVGGDLDGEFEASEVVRLTTTLAGFADTATAQISVSSTDPWLTLSASPVNVNVPYGGTTSASFQFTVKGGVPADRVATVTLRVQSGSLVRNFPLEVQLAPSFRAPVELPPNMTQALVQLPDSKAAFVSDDLDWRTNGHWRVTGRIRQANGLFSQPVILSNPAVDASNGVATAGANGVVHAVFRQYDETHNNPKFYYVTYQPSTSSWSTAELVGTEHFPNWFSPVAEESIVLDSAGRPHISWYDFNPNEGRTEVRTAVRTANGWVRTTHFSTPGLMDGDNNLVALPNGHLGFFYTLGQNGTQYLAEWDGTTWSTPRVQEHGGLKSGTKHPFAFDGQVYRVQAEGNAMGAPYQLAVLANDYWTPVTQIGSTLDNYTFKEEIAVEMYGTNRFGALMLKNGALRFVTTNGSSEVVANLRYDSRDMLDNAALGQRAAGYSHGFIRGYVNVGPYFLNSYTSYLTNAPVSGSLRPSKPLVTDSGATTSSPIVTVSWSSSGAPPASYRLGVGTAPGRDDVVRFQRVTGTSATLDLNALLEPGRTYYFSVSGVGSFYASEVGVSDGLLYAPVLRCTADAWNATFTYADPGTQVTYGGNTYRNLWNNSGSTPTPQGNGPWKLVGACSGQPALSVCDNPAWNAGAIYQSGEVVNYGGYEFLNLWYTQGQVPTGQNGNAWRVIGACPTN